MPDSAFWIIGAGHFGRLACRRLLSTRPSLAIRVVDRQYGSVPSGVDWVVGDAVAYLQSNLTSQTNAWIVPAVPFHLAYEWLARQLMRAHGFYPHAVPESILPILPNPCRGRDGQVYLSNADFRCPDDCPEPQSICFHTHKPRPRIMHTFLSNLVYKGYTSVVVRSFQLAPGVGGFKAATLWGLYQDLLDQEGRFLFSTACKCHAVLNAFSLGMAHAR